MVLLTVTPAARSAVVQYSRLRPTSDSGHELCLDDLEIGKPIEHHLLVEVSQFLVKKYRSNDGDLTEHSVKDWRLDTLLKGAIVYQPPPPTKPEPTPEFKALMRRLRAEEEHRQYERMINPPPPHETFGQRFPHGFNPAISHGQSAIDQVDDVTYADVNRQMILIINVLVSIIACSVAIWIGARHWSVPQRLGLSMSGSGIVAVAEVVIYMGYIRRVKEAKDEETKRTEKKEVVETWETDKAAQKSSSNNTVRSRKGKHR